LCRRWPEVVEEEICQLVEGAPRTSPFSIDQYATSGSRRPER
jgi:hypothetical protein